MIEFIDVSYEYPGAERPAVDGVDARVLPGSVTALLGANGSGKSTLARMANGIVAPRSGRVLVDGLCAHEAETVWEVRTRVGMVFQNPDDQIVGTVVEEDVAFGPENLGVERDEMRRRVTESLAAVGLEGTGASRAPPAVRGPEAKTRHRGSARDGSGIPRVRRGQDDARSRGSR